MWRCRGLQIDNPVAPRCASWTLRRSGSTLPGNSQDNGQPIFCVHQKRPKYCNSAQVQKTAAARCASWTLRRSRSALSGNSQDNGQPIFCVNQKRPKNCNSAQVQKTAAAHTLMRAGKTGRGDESSARNRRPTALTKDSAKYGAE